MAIEPALRSTSRRALLAGAAGALGRAQPVSAAADFDLVHLGVNNDAATTTTVHNTNNGYTAFSGEATGEGIGLSGFSQSGDGVHAYSGSGTGVYATGGGTGVYGFSGSSYGVYGFSFSGSTPAAVGQSAGGNTGLQGFSGPDDPPASPAKTGVHGSASQDATAVGVLGESASGRGGLFAGARAQVRLKPSTALTHPASGQKGDLFVDKSGRLWFCRGSTSWTRLA